MQTPQPPQPLITRDQITEILDILADYYQTNPNLEFASTDPVLQEYLYARINEYIGAIQ